MKRLLSCVLLGMTVALSAVELLEVKFGVDTRWADMTEAVRKEYKRNDNLYFGNIDAHRLAGKDPAHGVKKSVIFRYRDESGREMTSSFGERGYAGVSDGVVISDDFKLGRAWFGRDANYIDITPAITEIIKSGKKVNLDFKTLGINASTDPAPGKRKEIVIFYSIDNESKLQVYFERDAFQGSMIDGSYNPIELAAEVTSPFTGLELDKAVWQWAVPLKSVISKENGEHPIAYLWIPENTRKLRGVVMGPFNMLERPIMEHPVFRAGMARLDYGCIWIAPSFFGAHFNFKDPKQAAAIEEAFNSLADVSGYDELRTIPFVGIGHSAMADFPYQLASWRPERAVCGISYDGGALGVDWHYKLGNNTILDEQSINKLAGIPLLQRDGEYSGGRGNRRPCVIANHNPEILMSFVSDPGAGHFGGISDHMMEYLAYFISKADKARGVGSGKLKRVPAESGWHVDFWQNGKAPRAKAAPAKEFKAPEGSYGKEFIWVFDEEHARKLEAYQTAFDGKKIQLLGYEQQGKVLPDRKTHAQIHPGFHAEKDGQSFPLRAVFIDAVTEGRATGWTGKKVGDPVEHGNDSENIVIAPICGPVVALGNGKMAVRFERFGFTSSRRSREIYMMARHPGDDTFRPIELQSTMMVPLFNGKGIYQKISFPEIPDQKLGTASYALNATVNTGLPVEYFVVYGPAYIKDHKLIFTEIPPGSKFPVEVKVTAYQYGTKNAPEVKSAIPVTRTLKIVK